MVRDDPRRDEFGIKRRVMGARRGRPWPSPRRLASRRGREHSERLSVMAGSECVSILATSVWEAWCMAWVAVVRLRSWK